MAEDGLGGSVLAGSKGKPSGILVMALAIFLYIWDLVFGFNGFDFGDIAGTGWKLFLAVPLNLWLFINVFLYLWKPADQKVMWSRFFVSFVILDILVLGGFSGGGVGHLFIPLLIYFLWMRNVTEDESQANIMFGILLIIDFVGYGALQYYIHNTSFISGEAGTKLADMLSNRLIVPVWGYYALFSSYQYEKDSMSTIILILLLGMSIFYLVDDSTAMFASKGYLNPEMTSGLMAYAGTSWNRMWTTLSGVKGKMTQSYEMQMEYATGGYYKGEVEKNVEEPLGVFIENLMLAQDKYTVGQTVILWGDLKAKTLKEEMIINIECKTEGGKIGTAMPSAPIKVYALDEEGLECRFEGLDAGTHTLNLAAKFNFETMSYLKTYYMEIERLRSLRRSGIDPLDQYGITDKKPVSLSTNGPIRFNIESNSLLPIGLAAPSTDEDMSQNPRLGITVENKWNGKILSISDLIIQIPESMKLVETNSRPCNGYFEVISKEAAKAIIDTSTTSGDDESSDLSGYKIYKLTPEGKLTFTFPIERFESLKCSLEAENVGDALGQNPIATHYYRGYVKYNYSFKSSKGVTIEGVTTGTSSATSGFSIIVDTNQNSQPDNQTYSKTVKLKMSSQGTYTCSYGNEGGITDSQDVRISPGSPYIDSWVLEDG
ncbi:MAG: hypothetical protein ABIJ08_05965 [Nanoarchaeota archaeon]